MHIWDITRTIHDGLSVWPGDPTPLVEPQLQANAGDTINTSVFRLGSHTGTHVDAPAHLFANGKTVDQLDLRVLVGPAVVVDCSAYQEIQAATLDARVCSEYSRVLLKLAEPNCLDGSFTSTVPLTLDAAQWVIDHHIKLIGITGPTVDRFDADALVIHRRLLAADIIIVENLWLQDIPKGEYNLACLPLPIAGTDGAPARAILWTD
ncbi:MAG: cyclase family protein [Chloroflexi bacterium]|nr:cyclase family protein [Chloroflexota bacterium]